MFLPVPSPFRLYKILENTFFSSLEKKEPKETPPTGLDAIFGLGGRRVILHVAEAGVDNTQ